MVSELDDPECENCIFAVRGRLVQKCSFCTTPDKHFVKSYMNVMCNFFLSSLRKQESVAGNVPNQGALDSCFRRNDRQLGKVAHGVI
jgi:hypothetical protein